MKKVFIFIVIGLLCATFILFSCIRSNLPSKAPVYPNSTLVKQSSSGTDRLRVDVYHYESEAAPEAIIRFYEGKGSCGSRPNTPGPFLDFERCVGDASPFGRYYVTIDLDDYDAEGITRYFVEIHWSTYIQLY